MIQEECFVCSCDAWSRLSTWQAVNNHEFFRCGFCGIVLALPTQAYREFSYEEYGTYLTINKSAARHRIERIKKDYRRLFTRVATAFEKPQLLDFGSGAGFFCQAAQESGLCAVGVEPSRYLREYCKTEIGFQNVLASLGELRTEVHVACMWDVIEHLPAHSSRVIMQDLTRVIRPGGILTGNTPNVHSFNLWLSRDNDPVVAPPSHCCYFSTGSLSLYLSSLGFRRERLFSKGLSANGLLRKNKDTPCFVERSWRQIPLALVPAWTLTRAVVAVGGHLVRPFGRGYQIHFSYQKIDSAASHRQHDGLHWEPVNQ